MRANALKWAFGMGLATAMIWAPGCSSDDEPSGTAGKGGTGGGTGGSGATGGSGSGATGGSGGGGSSVECGTETCEEVPTTATLPPLPGCCPPDTTNTCGVDVSLLSALQIEFPEPCQAQGQPGNRDTDCPNLSFTADIPTVGPTPINLNGCCRADTSTCGYLADRILIVNAGLGCIDSTPFLEGGTAASCTPSGAGGAGGTGGEDGGDGSAGTAGTAGSGGMAGGDASTD